MPIKRTWFHEIELSFRHEGGKLTCCFVNGSGVQSGGQRTILDSRHFTGPPEAIVDQALQHARELVLEHVLSPEEPF